MKELRAREAMMCNNTMLKRIQILATEFRRAVEIARREGCFTSDIVMRGFPRGCCGDASDLVGEYLLNAGYENIWYVCGTYYPDTEDEDADFLGRQSHAWISIGYPTDTDSIVVDITGDQFQDSHEYEFYNEPVYVGTMDDFHGLFEIEDRDCSKFSGIITYDDFARGRLQKLYNMIVERMDKCS